MLRARYGQCLTLLHRRNSQKPRIGISNGLLQTISEQDPTNITTAYPKGDHSTSAEVNSLFFIIFFLFLFSIFFFCFPPFISYSALYFSYSIFLNIFYHPPFFFSRLCHFFLLFFHFLYCFSSHVLFSFGYFFSFLFHISFCCFCC